jgi:hypothetical protein
MIRGTFLHSGWKHIVFVVIWLGERDRTRSIVRAAFARNPYSCHIVICGFEWLVASWTYGSENETNYKPEDEQYKANFQHVDQCLAVHLRLRIRLPVASS